MPSLLNATTTDTVHRSFEQAVPRALVHKRLPENVLLTEYTACADDRFICTGRFPTDHQFFNDAGRTPATDILFYTELGRQASLAVSHAFLDVSREDVFIFEGSDAVLMAAAETAAHRQASESVVIDIRLQEVTRRRNNVVNRVVAEHVMWVGGQRVFHGTGAWTVQPAALFARLRKGATPRSESSSLEAAPQAGIDATRARIPHASGNNIVISPPRHIEGSAGLVSSLIVDRGHPYFFDHPCDHVPGMLLLEGCAQLAIATCPPAAGASNVSCVSAYGVTFAQFVEVGIPATLTADVDGGRRASSSARRPAVRITVTQQDVVCGTATMELAAAITA